MWCVSIYCVNNRNHESQKLNIVLLEVEVVDASIVGGGVVVAVVVRVWAPVAPLRRPHHLLLHALRVVAHSLTVLTLEPGNGKWYISSRFAQLCNRKYCHLSNWAIVRSGQRPRPGGGWPRCRPSAPGWYFFDFFAILHPGGGLFKGKLGWAKMAKY